MSSEPSERKQLNLAGKDYFAEDEAAFYACVSLSQFRKRCKDEGILAVPYMGKKVYRKADIAKSIEDKWQIFNGHAMGSRGS